MFTQARWEEPLMIQLSHPRIDQPEVRSEELGLPQKIRRRIPPSLPEVSEIEVIRHYTRLSQQNFGVDLGIYPLGSCTMKYNPKLCDLIASSHKMQEIHPYQDQRTIQGILQIMYETSSLLANIVGVEKITLQPSAGAHGEYTGVMLMRAYHADRNDPCSRRNHRSRFCTWNKPCERGHGRLQGCTSAFSRWMR